MLPLQTPCGRPVWVQRDPPGLSVLCQPHCSIPSSPALARWYPDYITASQGLQLGQMGPTHILGLRIFRRFEIKKLIWSNNGTPSLSVLVRCHTVAAPSLVVRLRVLISPKYLHTFRRFHKIFYIFCEMH